MPYVREKRVPGKNGKTYRYYQLVEGKRVDGKVRQRVIAHLGKHDSIEAAREAAVGHSVASPDSQPVNPEVEDTHTTSVVPNHFYHLPSGILAAPKRSFATAGSGYVRLRTAASEESRTR